MAVVSGSLISSVFKAGGVGGAVHNSFPSSNRQGIKKRAQRASTGNLLKKCGEAPMVLSHSSHTGHMEPAKPARIVLLILGALLCAAWGLIIWTATIVAQTMLDTLSYIIELAQMG